MCGKSHLQVPNPNGTPSLEKAKAAQTPRTLMHYSIRASKTRNISMISYWRRRHCFFQPINGRMEIRLDFYWQSAHALHVCSVNTHDELNPNGTAWKQCENQKTQWHCVKTMHVYWSALQSKSIWQSVRAMHVCWQSQQSKSPWQTMKARHARWPIQLIAKQNLCVVIKSTLIT